MRRQLFGTDGVRGVAGEYPLDDETVFALGAALGGIAARHAAEPEVVIGMDTRESGPRIAALVGGGLESRGVRVRFAGVTTTPGVAYLTRSDDYVAGVMISASHNPYRDNGIKVFGHSGYKLPDEEEHAIEQEIFALLEAGVSAQPAGLEPDAGLDRHYADYLASTVSRSFEGLRIVMDCGNGASSSLAPELFERLGAKVTAICAAPDGRNINLGCGALYVDKLRESVLKEGADAGVAFDGDADRAIFVSRTGKIVNGDGVLLMAARRLHELGRLKDAGGKPAVVATVMSNLGLERALAARGIGLLRTPVGDKYVLEEMLRTGIVLGGEQSGHVIFLDWATTGDGLLTAIRVFEMMREAGAGLDELTAELQIYPQRLVNVRVRSKKPLAELPGVTEEIQAAERAFGHAGRVLVRFSGTELLARVMVEGPELAQVDAVAARIAGLIERELGAPAA
ncbi:MAG TPA: phosphoglucosamine mutase [Bryobacteraceae bacterium]|nr:phosphoglucosamine mutase [Bryobacteraceae bacterium]